MVFDVTLGIFSQLVVTKTVQLLFVRTFCGCVSADGACMHLATSTFCFFSMLLLLIAAWCVGCGWFGNTTPTPSSRAFLTAITWVPSTLQTNPDKRFCISISVNQLRRQLETTTHVDVHVAAWTVATGTDNVASGTCDFTPLAAVHMLLQAAMTDDVIAGPKLPGLLQVLLTQGAQEHRVTYNSTGDWGVFWVVHFTNVFLQNCVVLAAI